MRALLYAYLQRRSSDAKTRWRGGVVTVRDRVTGACCACSLRGNFIKKIKMERLRPSYSYCRTLNFEEAFIYIYFLVAQKTDAMG
jgi:hypothetical protein